MTNRPSNFLRVGSVLAVCSIAICAHLLSCTPQRRYRVLSVFLDGVPDPDNPSVATETPDFVIPNSSDERVAALGYSLTQPEFSWHKPVREKKCDQCHSVELSESGAKRIKFLPDTGFLIKPYEELCRSCHEFDKTNQHGPVSAGQCGVCHHAHRSPQPHLLRFEASRIREVCLSCHWLPDLEFLGRHSGESLSTDCTDCHDPHESDRPFLLRLETGGRTTG